MINSMTAFSKQQTHNELGILTFEVRSVNSRFLDVSMRLPETLRELEIKLRQATKHFLERGKVDVTLRFQPGEAVASSLTVNQALLKQLKSAIQTVHSELSVEGGVDVMRVLRWPGVVLEEEVSMNTLHETIITLFKKTLVDLQEARAREGEQLAKTMADKVDEIEVLVEKIKQYLPEIIDAQKLRLNEKFNAAKLEVDSERFEQEVVLILQKLDVVEELDRLQTHIVEIRRILKQGGVVGRRLDFLIQELHREANTLGAKSVHQMTTQISMDLKVLIEQIREQVQNIE